MCGFFKNFVRQGLGLAGKHLMNAANAATGGLAGKLVNGAVDGATKNAGVIGKVASQLGKRFLSDKTRNWLSKTADKALPTPANRKIILCWSRINHLCIFFITKRAFHMFSSFFSIFCLKSYFIIKKPEPKCKLILAFYVNIFNFYIH